MSAADRPPLIPEARARDRRPAGVPLELADGRTWLLARGGTRASLDPVRDSLYADIVLGDSAPVRDLTWAGYALLLANYDLDAGELGRLFAAVEPRALADAVADALFGEEPGRRERGYSAWCRVMLRANAIDPDAISAEELPWVLELLVATGRAVPPERWTDAGIAAGRFREAQEAAEVSIPTD